MKIIDNKKIFIWYLYIFKNIIEINELELFKKLSDTFYIHERDYLNFDFENKNLNKIINNIWNIIWNFYFKDNDFWYLEGNYDIKEIYEIIVDLINFLERNEWDLEILNKKIFDFLDKNNLLYLYN